jgi:DNA-binding SARP family transcriptional activator/tetratricopeptide (TPR) repeat protein
MPIHLTTLGGLRAHRDEAELDWLLGQRSRAAILVYLAIERRVSRESLTTVFWPESDGENARHALRQSLYHLRRALGSEWIEAGPHELRVSAEVHTDVQAFLSALERGDAASAVQLYRKPFLDGVNLIDVKSWESWVDSRRAQYARGFRKAGRDWVEARRAAGDLEGAIEAAQWWVAPDAFDDEAQHQLIRTLADAGQRADAIRQYEVYARLLESEGLFPPEETVELVERARSSAAAWPALQVERDPDPEERPAPATAGHLRSSSAAKQPSGTSRRNRPAILVATLLALMLVLAALWGLPRSRPDTMPALSPSAIAVLPFSVRGGTDAQYLGEGMVNLLGTALDGGASIRTIDARAVFAVVAQDGGGTPSLERGSRLAGRLGAGLFVLGSVVEAGEMLQIEAAIYPSGGAAEPLSRVVVSGDAGRVFDLVDNLAARLLADLTRSSTDRLTRTAAVTTTSLAAFKAYLEGEAHLRAGRFELAEEAYLNATAYDSTFAIALYRLSLARDWAARSGFEEAARAAARHAERLSPRDRALLEALQAYQSGDAPDAERRYRAILARYPDDLDAWFQLAEILFHYGPLRGHSAAAAEAAWRTVLFYEPRNFSALVHLARSAAARGRVATLDSLLARFSPEELATDRRLVQVGLLRAVAAGDTAVAATLAQATRSWEDAAVWQLGGYLTAYTSEPAGARKVIRDMIESRRGPGMIGDQHWFLALLHLENGQSADAWEALADGVAAKRAVPSEWHRWAFELVTEWSIATLPLPHPESTLERVRRKAASLDVSRWKVEGDSEANLAVGDQIWLALLLEVLGEQRPLEALRQYTVGLLSLRLDDPGSAAEAARVLSRLAGSEGTDPFVRDLDRGLRARIAWLDGRPEEGLRLLEGLELGPSPLGTINVIPFVARGNERFLRGELLIALSREAEALAWFESLGELSVPESPFRAPAHLRQAEIHERLGDPAEAARHYGRLVDLWRDGDPEFQPLVDTARERLAVLTGSARF